MTESSPQSPSPRRTFLATLLAAPVAGAGLIGILHRIAGRSGAVEVGSLSEAPKVTLHPDAVARTKEGSTHNG